MSPGSGTGAAGAAGASAATNCSWGKGGRSGTGGASGAASPPSYVTPGSTGTIRVLPARSTGRTASNRALSHAGDGGAITNTAAVVDTFSAASTGRITRASCENRASVVLCLEYSFGRLAALHVSPGPSGPQPTMFASRSQ